QTNVPASSCSNPGAANAACSNVTYTPQFKGYSNMALDLAQLGTLFASPTKIAIWGSSAGGLGADCNLNQFHAKWPSATWYQMSNAGAPLTALYEPGIYGMAQTWGVYSGSGAPGNPITYLTCPGINPAGGLAPWDPIQTLGWNDVNLTSVRRALT